jgi:HEAT repeat protein
VPPDVWPVAALHPVPGLAARLLGYLEHPTAAHRAAAARGLGRLGDERTRPFLIDRLGREQDADVRRALEWSIG